MKRIHEDELYEYHLQIKTYLGYFYFEWNKYNLLLLLKDYLFPKIKN